MEKKAREQGLEKLFILTTQTAHWFRERGFEEASLNELPMGKLALYNYRRNAKVFIKKL
jgi:amino-acid N-acetyltransferase